MKNLKILSLSLLAATSLVETSYPMAEVSPVVVEEFSFDDMDSVNFDDNLEDTDDNMVVVQAVSREDLKEKREERRKKAKKTAAKVKEKVEQAVANAKTGLAAHKESPSSTPTAPLNSMPNPSSAQPGDKVTIQALDGEGDSDNDMIAVQAVEVESVNAQEVQLTGTQENTAPVEAVAMVVEAAVTAPQETVVSEVQSPVVTTAAPAVPVQAEEAVTTSTEVAPVALMQVASEKMPSESSGDAVSVVATAVAEAPVVVAVPSEESVRIVKVYPVFQAVSSAVTSLQVAACDMFNYIYKYVSGLRKS